MEPDDPEHDPATGRASGRRRVQPPAGPVDLAGLVDFSAVFGRLAPLEAEVGAGQGGFALDHAAAHPGIDLVAIEVRKKLAALVEERRRRRGLSNLLVLCADAREALPRMFAPRSIDVLHVQFPDPWWKRRHHGRRLVRDELAVLLYNLLRPGGLLEVRTDVEQRGVEMDELLEAVGFVNRFGPRVLAPHDPGEVPSTRERGYLARGQPVYRYQLTRTEAPPRPAPPLETRVGMESRRR